MWDISTLDTVASTQETVRARLREDPHMPEGTGVRAIVQTGGRGRHGRVWDSQDGDLTFSFLLRPARPVAEWGSLALLAGVALAQAARQDTLCLKWPNDALLGGRKCAGILCEIEEDALIVGLGVNCMPVAEGGDRASLHGQWVAPALMDAFLRQFAPLYERWTQAGFAQVKPLWMHYAHAPGTPVSVKQGPQSISGFFEGVGDDGSLLFKDEKGVIKSLTAGELTVG